jgi:hypothetical protein
MANVKISALTSLTTMTDATVVPVVESATTKKITGANLKNYFNKSSIIRAQRAVGGTETTPGKWTFTTISGTATAEWVANGSVAYPALGLASNPYIIFTFTGFSKLPIDCYRLGVTGSSPGLTNRNLGEETVTNQTSPNVLTAFDSTLHKYAFPVGSVIGEDWYFEFRE